MKRITFLVLTALFALVVNAKAQTVKDGVLISWPMATGDIKIPDEVVEIAANCFFADDSEWGGEDGDWGGEDGWEGYSVKRSTLRSANTEITSVDFNNVRKIGKEAFKECRGIKSVKMPHVEEIGESAFESCDNHLLTRLDLPAIKKIEKNAFASCDALTTVFLGGELEAMGKNPFYNCTNITKFEIGKNAAFKVSNGLVLSSDETQLAIVLPSVVDAVLPESVTSVLDGAVQSQKAVKTFKGINVTTVGEYAFSSAYSLESVELPKLQTVGFLAFEGIGGLRVMDIHESQDFKEFGNYNNGGPADKETLTIYVANETVKTALKEHYKSAKIEVGAASGELKKFKVNFVADPADAAFFEAWINGPIDVESGNEVSEGATLSVKCRYKFMSYEFVNWTVNGEVVATTEDNPTLLVIPSVDKELNIVAHLNKLPEGNRVYFKSTNPNNGTVTAFVDGKEFKSSGIVPTGKSVKIVATPTKGFEVTDWLFENSEGKYIPNPELQGKKEWTMTPDKELSLYVRFERTQGSVVINYLERSGNGKLSCKMADGTPVLNNEAIPSGKTLKFIAEPNPGFKVGTWIVGEEERVEKDDVLTIENVTTDLEVYLICYKEDHVDPNNEPVIDGDVLKEWKAVGNVRVPDNVKHIADFAFKSANLTGLTISSDVESIGELPFMFCGSLKTLIVEDGNKHFKSENNAIYTKDGKELVQVATAYQDQTFTLPASVEKVRPGAFTFAMNIKTINVDSNNKFFESIDGMLIRKQDNALIHYPSFIVPNEKPEDIILPESIKKIERYACAFNFKLNKLTLPDAIEELGDYAFTGSPNLQDISFENCTNLKRVGDYCFKACFRLPQFNVPASGLKYIGEQALQGTAIVLLNVPDGVQIGANAFRGCQSIAVVNSFSANPPVIDDLAFSDIAEIDAAKLNVSKGAKSAYEEATGWNIFKNIIEVANLSAESVLESNIVFAAIDDAVSVSGLNNAVVDVYNVSGEMLHSVRGSGNIQLPLGHGTFVVVVTEGAERLIKKIIL